MQLAEHDAVFFSDAVQIEFLQSQPDVDLAHCWTIPLSLQAYGLLLRKKLTRVLSYADFVDFQDCKRWYLDEGLQRSRDWLIQLGLSFEIEGIDVAELDAPCQFLLFTHLRFIERTAERIIAALPEIERFYIVQARDLLEHEFYFDSDVSGAVLRAVCERLGRQIEVIEMKTRPRHLYPDFQARPMTDAGLKVSETPLNSSQVSQVGFAPAALPYAAAILDSIRDFHPVAFPSVWGPRQSLSEVSEIRLSAQDGPWSKQISAELANVYREFRLRRNRSTLPAALITNGYLDFQFEYIIQRRWLAYANMIHRGKQLVRDFPVDLFIHADHFTAEGAVLSRLYRNEGKKILVSLHSNYPCDRNWATWDHTDRAMVPSRSAAARLLTISQMQEVFVTGDPASRTYRSLRRSNSQLDLSGRKKAAVGDRKLLLVITNALELDSVPFVDLKVHFEAFAQLAKMANFLKDRVACALRTKRGWFGEDPILYEQLSGFFPESFDVVDGASFSDCIKLADCIVGVNVPTTGYYEILQGGVPLIHFQTAEVVSRHPDLPGYALLTVTDAQSLLTAIEAVLFDSRYGEEIVARQNAFAARDFIPTLSDTADPVRSLVARLIQKPVHNASKLASHDAIEFDGMTVSTHGVAGSIDDMFYAPNGRGQISGWAADLGAGRAAKSVHLFLKKRWLAKAVPCLSRPDVAAAYKKPALQATGFSVAFQLETKHLLHAVELYAELPDGTFHRLSRSFEIESS